MDYGPRPGPEYVEWDEALEICGLDNEGLQNQLECLGEALEDSHQRSDRELDEKLENQPPGPGVWLPREA